MTGSGQGYGFFGNTVWKADEGGLDYRRQGMRGHLK